MLPTLEEYMADALYDPKDGYYMQNIPIGKDGDFTTAPEISQLFGEMLAAWAVNIWEGEGKPSPCTLLEVGAGKGTLMADMLRTIQKIAPELWNTLRVEIAEISPKLTEVQKEALSAYTSSVIPSNPLVGKDGIHEKTQPKGSVPAQAGIHEKISWVTDIKHADFSHPTFLIANEVLDAFPIQQFERVEGNTYKQRHVKEENGKLSFFLDGISLEFEGAPDILEHSPARNEFLGFIKENLNGHALFIDYGAENGEYQADTLQALMNHKKVHPLEHTGKADLTAHVNFTEVRQILGEEHCSNAIPMGAFLSSLGIVQRASALIAQNPNHADKVASDLHRLLHPTEMGELFKVVSYQNEKCFEK